MRCVLASDDAFWRPLFDVGEALGEVAAALAEAVGLVKVARALRLAEALEEEVSVHKRRADRVDAHHDERVHPNELVLWRVAVDEQVDAEHGGAVVEVLAREGGKNGGGRGGHRGGPRGGRAGAFWGVARVRRRRAAVYLRRAVRRHRGGTERVGGPGADAARARRRRRRAGRPGL